MCVIINHKGERIMRFEYGWGCWFHNNIIEPLSRFYDKHKKTHYECCVCGNMEAPYFDSDKYCSMKWDYGWHKLQGSNRWICHHCADHGFALNTDQEIPPWERDFTWDEWQRNVVKPNREYTENLIKEKDPEYYAEYLSLRMD